MNGFPILYQNDSKKSNKISFKKENFNPIKQEKLMVTDLNSRPRIKMETLPIPPLPRIPELEVDSDDEFDFATSTEEEEILPTRPEGDFIKNRAAKIGTAVIEVSDLKFKLDAGHREYYKYNETLSKFKELAEDLKDLIHHSAEDREEAQDVIELLKGLEKGWENKLDEDAEALFQTEMEMEQKQEDLKDLFYGDIVPYGEQELLEDQIVAEEEMEELSSSSDEESDED